MTDQCKHCTFRGDLKACQAAECHKHDDWYSVRLNKRIAELEKDNKLLKQGYDTWHGQWRELNAQHKQLEKERDALIQAGCDLCFYANDTEEYRLAREKFPCRYD